MFGLRGLALAFFLSPLIPAAFINLFSGRSTQLVGTLLGLGLGALAIRTLNRARRGDARRAAVLVGVATGLATGLGANAGPIAGVLLGFGAFWGARLAYGGIREAAPPAPPPPPRPRDALTDASDRLAALIARSPAPMLLPAAHALRELVEDLIPHPERPEEARRYAVVMTDGLERIALRLERGAEATDTLPALLDDMHRGALSMQNRLRERETIALDVQVKVLSDRLKQEGLA
jgi:MFS family permease